MGRKISSNFVYQLSSGLGYFICSLEQLPLVIPVPQQKRSSKNQLQSKCDQDVT